MFEDIFLPTPDFVSGDWASFTSGKLRPSMEYPTRSISRLLRREDSSRLPKVLGVRFFHRPSRSAVPLPPNTLTRTSFLPSLWISPGLVFSPRSPRCEVLSVIPWIRQNSPPDRPLAPNSLTSRWRSASQRGIFLV
jgi:hypothetical protein